MTRPSLAMWIAVYALALITLLLDLLVWRPF